MKLLTVPEAAQYLRMSRSSLYQRKDIPRYRRPGSRVILFDEAELEAWLKQGRTVIREAFRMKCETSHQEGMSGETSKGLLEFTGDSVYHRNSRYR